MATATLLEFFFDQLRIELTKVAREFLVFLLSYFEFRGCHAHFLLPETKKFGSERDNSQTAARSG